MTSPAPGHDPCGRFRLRAVVIAAAAVILPFLIPASEVEAQEAAVAFAGDWSGRIQTRREAQYDPADMGRRRRGGGRERIDVFWHLRLAVGSSDGLTGAHRTVQYMDRALILGNATRAELVRVTDIDDDEIEFEWSREGSQECEAKAEIKTDPHRLEGRYTCRTPGSGMVMEWVERGRFELTRHDAEEGGS